MLVCSNNIPGLIRYNYSPLISV